MTLVLSNIIVVSLNWFWGGEMAFSWVPLYLNNELEVGSNVDGSSQNGTTKDKKKRNGTYRKREKNETYLRKWRFSKTLSKVDIFLTETKIYRLSVEGKNGSQIRRLFIPFGLPSKRNSLKKEVVHNDYVMKLVKSNKVAFSFGKRVLKNFRFQIRTVRNGHALTRP